MQRREHKLKQNYKCVRCGQHGFHQDNVKVICTIMFINIYTAQNLSNIIIKVRY
jgi:predicted nucleic-acid-binding Zn-ribbon protein